MNVVRESKNKSFSKKIIIGIRRIILEIDKMFGRFISVIEIRKDFSGFAFSYSWSKF